MDIYDWKYILKNLKEFAGVENISEIIIIGEKDGIRRIKLEPMLF